MLLLCLALAPLWQGLLPAAAEEVFQIRIVHRDVNEVLATVKPLVGPYGYISADVPSNSLIVIDDPASVARIQALIAKIDQPVPQLKITLQYGFRETRQEEGVAVQGEIDLGDAEVGLGAKETDETGVDVGLAWDEQQMRDRGEYTVIVRSGSTATINSGYDVPYPDRWSDLSHRHGHVGRSVTFKKVDTGFDVRPVLIGNAVQIEITPRISYMGERGINLPIRFAEAATRVNVPLGEWVEIAGSDTGFEDLHRQILSGGRSSGDARMRIRLRVTRT